MTKAQEMELLEQIADLIEQAGDDSYIGRAFEGCYLMAKSNIKDDFWNSMKEQRDLNQAEAEKWMDKAEEYKKELDASKQLREDLEKNRDFLLEKVNETKKCNTELWNQLCEQERKANELEQEVIQLKAKLYDLICK